MIEIDPVQEIGHGRNHGLQFLLPEDDYLQQFGVVGFIVQEFAQNLQALHAHFLALVDDQDNGLVLPRAALQQGTLDHFLERPGVQPAVGQFATELGAEQTQKSVGRRKGRIKQQADGNRRILAQIAHKTTTKRGFARTDIADHEIQAAFEPDRYLQFLETGDMLL